MKWAPQFGSNLDQVHFLLTLPVFLTYKCLALNLPVVLYGRQYFVNEFIQKEQNNIDSFGLWFIFGLSCAEQKIFSFDYN